MFLLGERANPYLILFSYFMKVKPLSPPPPPPPPTPHLMKGDWECNCARGIQTVWLQDEHHSFLCFNEFLTI